MPFEQWINSRCGFDISVSRFVVEATAIVKQAIEAMSTLRTLHCACLVYLPSIREATDNGNALGLPGLSVAQLNASSWDSGVGCLRDRAFDLWVTCAV
jgi:hypothetical protein